MTVFICFGLGLILGSFANVYFSRVPQNLSVVRPRSFCPHCKNQIPWHDNIPLLSYLLLKGRCRFCRSPISLRYPLIEAATGILFLSVYWRFEYFMLPAVAGFILFSYLVFLIGGIDWTTYLALNKEYGIIPDHLTVPLALFGLGFAPWNPLLNNPWQGPGTGLGVLVALLAFRQMMNMALKRESLGLGDIKMLSAAAIWLGFKGIFLCLMVASILGTAISILFMAFKKNGQTFRHSFRAVSGPWVFKRAFPSLEFVEKLSGVARFADLEPKT